MKYVTNVCVKLSKHLSFLSLFSVRERPSRWPIAAWHWFMLPNRNSAIHHVILLRLRSETSRSQSLTKLHLLLMRERQRETFYLPFQTQIHIYKTYTVKLSTLNSPCRISWRFFFLLVIGAAKNSHLCCGIFAKFVMQLKFFWCFSPPENYLN